MIFRRFCLVLAFVLLAQCAIPGSIPGITIRSEAAPLPPASSSDAVEEDDPFPPISDFLELAPMSSLASIQSTINFKDTYINVRYKNKNGTYVYYPIATGVNQFTYDLSKIDGDVSRLGIVLDKGALPAPGTYRLQIDYASQVGIDWYQFSFWAHKYSSNAATGSKEVIFTDYVKQSSGDYYADLTIDLNNVSRLEIQGYFNAGTLKGLIGGKFAIRFTPVSDSRPDENVAAPGPSAEQQFQDTVSNGVSSIGDTLQEIVSTISLQLEALWDQMFNLMHVPQLQNDDKNTQQIISSQEDVAEQQRDNDDKNTGLITGAIQSLGNFLIEGLKSLFIPSDEFFGTYVGDLRTFFEEKLGFLYTPIDVFLRLCDIFLDAGAIDAKLTLPGFMIMGEEVWSEQEFDLGEFLNTNFGMLLTAIRMGTSVLIVFGFLRLLYQKSREVIGYDSGGGT